MLGQSLIDYVTLSSAAGTFQRARYSVKAWLGSLSSTDWAVAGAVVLVGLALRILRRSR